VLSCLFRSLATQGKLCIHSQILALCLEVCLLGKDLEPTGFLTRSNTQTVHCEYSSTLADGTTIRRKVDAQTSGRWCSMETTNRCDRDCDIRDFLKLEELGLTHLAHALPIRR